VGRGVLMAATGVGVAAGGFAGVEAGATSGLPVGLGVTLALDGGMGVARACEGVGLPIWMAGPSVSQLPQISTQTRTKPQIFPTSRATGASPGTRRPRLDRAETGLSATCAQYHSYVMT
jgi:hypothetical protein